MRPRRPYRAEVRDRTEESMTAEPGVDRAPIVALRRSQDHLVAVIGRIDDPTAPSYCDEWTVAQVGSHLGSGAEIALPVVGAAVRHEDPPGPETAPPIWDKWNAMAPTDQLAECLPVNEAHVAALEALTDDELAGAYVKLFGVIELDGPGVARFRLGEHLVHTWDIEVALDPTATLDGESAALIVDENLPAMIGFAGKPQGATWALAVETTDPTRSLVLRSTPDTLSLTPAGEDDGEDADALDGTLRLATEALLRLAYGRLDADHAAGVELDSSTITLDDVRANFPGL
jgi:uncharacterized protein (TIGR03083 family)